MEKKALLEEDNLEPKNSNGLNHSEISSNKGAYLGNNFDAEKTAGTHLNASQVDSQERINNQNDASQVEGGDEDIQQEINQQKYLIMRKFGEHIRDLDDVDETKLPKDTPFSPNTQLRKIEQQQISKIKKLTPAGTYFSLLKGFVCTGILYLPRNFQNGGWLWALISMVLSFILTLVCAIKLLQAKAKIQPGGSFSDIGFQAIGKPGKYMVDIFLGLSQIGFVTAYIYFITTSLKSVADEVREQQHQDEPAYKSDVSVIWFGALCFIIYVPLCLVRKIEKFAWTHLIADALILITTIVILVYALIQLSKYGWGTGNQVFNTATWLTMIGSSVYSYEGIGVILPLLEVTEKPELYPKILFYVLLTVMVLYVSFGEFCLFVYGNLIDKPLITSNLPKGVVVWIIKIFFSINLFFTYPLQIYPANVIIESYLFSSLPKSKKRQWLKNLSRTILILFTIVFCISMGDSIDKFISLLGSLTCTPISFTLPCIFHLKLCNPSRNEKIINYFIIVFSLFIMVFCSGYTIWHWNS
eukprot:403370085